MLEPATRLSTGTGFTSTAHRDLSSFACSVQPNRLPLRPAPPVPRRKPSLVCSARQKLSYESGDKTPPADKPPDEQLKPALQDKANGGPQPEDGEINNGPQENGDGEFDSWMRVGVV